MSKTDLSFPTTVVFFISVILLISGVGFSMAFSEYDFPTTVIQIAVGFWILFGMMLVIEMFRDFKERKELEN